MNRRVKISLTLEYLLEYRLESNDKLMKQIPTEHLPTFLIPTLAEDVDLNIEIEGV